MVVDLQLAAEMLQLLRYLRMVVNVYTSRRPGRFAAAVRLLCHVKHVGVSCIIPP